MIKEKNIMFGFTAVLGLAAFFLGPNASAAPIRGSHGYLTNLEGNIITNLSGVCWHSVEYTPADAIAECETVAAPTPVAMIPEKTVAPAPAVAPAPVASEKIILTSDTLFDLDKSDIKPAGRDTLDNLATKLEGNQKRVIVTGFTSSPGSDDHNMRLSQRRSEAVKAYLVSKGVDGNRIRTNGKGEQNPIADNNTAQGRGLNRRVEIEVTSASAF